MIKILIIDDSPEDRYSFKRYLSRDPDNRYEIHQASSGKEGLSKYEELHPDCVLLDYALPDTTGVEVLEQIKEKRGAELCPVIMLTGTGSEEIAVQAMKRGALDYLLKSNTSPEYLRRTVSNALEKKRLQLESLETEAKLRETNALQKAILDSAPNIVISTSPDGTILTFNKSAEKNLGYPVKEIIHKSTPLIFLDRKEISDRLGVISDKEEETFEPFIEKMQQSASSENEWTLLRRDGSSFIANLTLTKIYNDKDEFNGYLFVAEDITERKLAEQEREKLLEREKELREESERTNQLKDEFLATLSHELRSPMNVIMGWTNILRAGDMSAESVERAVEVIHRNVQTQNRLIEDILDVSRIITGKMTLETKPVELTNVIEAALEVARPAAIAKHITINTSFDNDSNFVSGDSNRLQQIIWNVVNNAVKFTPSGGRVDVTLNQTDHHAEVEIKDSGEGIAQEFLPFVFERFRQADGKHNRKHGGLGLGLAIVRHLTEMHGGTVAAHSDGEGLGATFKINLPLLSSGHKHTSQEEQISFDALAGIKVLVVDDEEDARELIYTLIKAFGADVTSATNAKEALAALSNANYDILISDIGMPVTDGYSLIKQIRASSEKHIKNIPAIAVTAYASRTDEARAIREGFQSHISKPIDMDSLVSTILLLTKNNLVT